ncbi:hypothetical protein D9M70_354370 [compost metagenome]
MAMHVDINVRWAQLTYQASCPGQKLRATAVMSPEAAAKALAVKLHPTVESIQAEQLKAAGQCQTDVWRCHLTYPGGK